MSGDRPGEQEIAASTEKNRVFSAGSFLIYAGFLYRKYPVFYSRTEIDPPERPETHGKALPARGIGAGRVCRGGDGTQYINDRRNDINRCVYRQTISVLYDCMPEIFGKILWTRLFCGNV